MERKCGVKAVDVSVARLRVGVDQLNDIVCEDDDVQGQDENINEDGQTSGLQQACVMKHGECVCADCAERCYWTVCSQ